MKTKQVREPCLHCSRYNHSSSEHICSLCKHFVLPRHENHDQKPIDPELKNITSPLFNPKCTYCREYVLDHECRNHECELCHRFHRTDRHLCHICKERGHMPNFVLSKPRADMKWFVDKGITTFPTFAKTLKMHLEEFFPISVTTQPKEPNRPGSKWGLVGIIIDYLGFDGNHDICRTCFQLQSLYSPPHIHCEECEAMTHTTMEHQCARCHRSGHRITDPHIFCNQCHCYYCTKDGCEKHEPEDHIICKTCTKTIHRSMESLQYHRIFCYGPIT